MRDKPEQCYAAGCPLACTCRHCGEQLETHVNEHCADGKSFESVGRGFVAGSGDPLTARYAFVLEAPGREEVSFQLSPVPGRAFWSDSETVSAEIRTRRRDYPDVPLKFLSQGAPVVGQSGAALQFWIWPKAGIKREEVYLDNTIRCVSFVKGVPKYPTGTTRQGAEKACRMWDRLDKFRPDTVVVGLHPAGILREITPLPLAVKDAEKVRDFTQQGRRVLSLLGGKAAQAFLRYASNVTRWRGHYAALAADWIETYRERFEFKAKKRKVAGSGAPRKPKKMKTKFVDPFKGEI